MNSRSKFARTAIMSIPIIFLCTVVSLFPPSTRAENSVDGTAIKGMIEALVDLDNGSEIIGISVWDDERGHDYLIEEDERELELRKHVNKIVKIVGAVKSHESNLYSTITITSFEVLK